MMLKMSREVEEFILSSHIVNLTQLILLPAVLQYRQMLTTLLSIVHLLITMVLQLNKRIQVTLLQLEAVINSLVVEELFQYTSRVSLRTTLLISLTVIWLTIKQFGEEDFL